MSQLPIRDKLKVIAEAVKHNDQINERSKNIGLTTFFIAAIIGLVAVLVLALLLAFNHYLKTALFLTIVAIFAFYIIYKLITAEDLNSMRLNDKIDNRKNIK